MVAKHTMKEQVMLHLLDCAEVDGIWHEDLVNVDPASKNCSSEFCGSVFLRG